MIKMNSKNNHFLLYILIEFFLFSIIESKAVVLKFNELYNDINSTKEPNYLNKNTIFSNDIDTNHFNDLYQNLIYTILDIGTPSQKMLGIFNPDSTAFTIGNQDNCYKKVQYNYSFTNSKSSNIIKKKDGDDYFPGYYILNDTIKIYTIENNTKKFEEINNFQLKFDEPKKSWGKVDTSDKLFCGDIGFQIDKQQEPWAKFLKQLNDKNLINSYIITMNYTSEQEGNFYIGEYPHEYDSDYYKESHIFTTNAIPRKSFSLFRILMNDIYIQINNNDIIKLKLNEVFFHLELGLIVCPIEYYNYITSKFFNKYLNESICYLKSMTQKLDSYNMIVCENNNNFDIESFPSLHFYHSDLNISFSLNYKDLFEAKDNKYYFLVVYSTFSASYWKLGKPFLKKYQITLNLDAKSISFYKNYVISNDDKNIDNNENNDGKGNNIVLILVCVGLSFILVVVSYFFIKNIKKEKKKKRANELKDDDYEYNADEENGKSDSLIKRNPVIN